MNSQERRPKLAAFLEFLEEEFGWEFNRPEFDDRFLLQKYVFFAQTLGYPLDYEYNVYIFGAYSPGLAQDYYERFVEPQESIENIAPTFDAEVFTDLVDSRDSEWLEIASTALLFNDRYSGFDTDRRRRKVIEKTADEKGVERSIVRTILSRLERLGLV